MSHATSNGSMPQPNDELRYIPISHATLLWGTLHPNELRHTPSYAIPNELRHTLIFYHTPRSYATPPMGYATPQLATPHPKSYAKPQWVTPHPDELVNPQWASSLPGWAITHANKLCQTLNELRQPRLSYTTPQMSSATHLDELCHSSRRYAIP